MRKIIILLLIVTTSCVSSRWFKVNTKEVEYYEFINMSNKNIVTVKEDSVIFLVPYSEFWTTHSLKKIVFKDVE